MQQIHDRHSEGRPRLEIPDDQLDELEITREKLVVELATTEAPVEDFQAKIARLKAQFDPAQIAIDPQAALPRLAILTSRPSAA